MSQWFDVIADDLLAFSDLATAPVVTPYPGHVEISWTRNDAEHRAEFRRAGDSVMVQPDGEDEVTYQQFLASPAMADLPKIASQIQKLTGQRRKRSLRTVKNADVYPYDWYVDPVLETTFHGVAGTGRALDTFGSIIDSEPNSSATDVVFLTALAGQGKSFMLQRLHAAQAARYLDGESSQLTFFVDAQGRGLAKLGDVLSRELNELRLPNSFHYTAMLALVRENLVTLIVDGFDELIGARGTYEDAFSSLTSFLQMLRGRGRLIAAARSTFFTQEYQSRANLLAGGDLSYEVSHAHLVPWDHNDQLQFVARASSESVVFGSEVRRRFEQAQESDAQQLLSRPLFARDALIAFAEDDVLPPSTSGLDLVENLVQGYLAREVGTKILNDRGEPILADAAWLAEFFEELAGEMWQLETRELDLSTAQVQMDLLLENWDVTPSERGVVRGWVGRLPFLQVGSQLGESISFEHEVFFDYFAAGSLSQIVFQDPKPQATLAKATLQQEEARFIAARALRMDSELGKLLDKLGDAAGRRHPRQQQVRTNAGTIAAALLQEADSSDSDRSVRLSDLVLAGVSLAGVRRDAVRMERCQLEGVDLRGSALSGAATDCVVHSIVVDSSTRLRLDGLDPELPVQQLYWTADGVTTPVFDAAETQRILELVGLAPESEEPLTLRFDVEPEVLQVVEGLCGAFEHLNPLGTGHTRYGWIFASDDWREVRDALLDEGLIEEESGRSTAGPKQTFYRKRFLPSDLMSALRSESERSSVEAFWRRVARPAR